MTVYGPPTAQEHLRQSMHGSIAYINRAPMCCCEGFDTETLVDPVKHTRNYGWVIWPALFLGVIIFFAISSI